MVRLVVIVCQLSDAVCWWAEVALAAALGGRIYVKAWWLAVVLGRPIIGAGQGCGPPRMHLARPWRVRRCLAYRVSGFLAESQKLEIGMCDAGVRKVYEGGRNRESSEAPRGRERVG